MATGAERTGAMIALVPTDADLDRLVFDEDDAELRDELHLTLWFLGDATTIDVATRAKLVTAVASLVERRELPVVEARAFGVAHWNPASDDPAWVLNVGNTPPDERDVDGDNLGVVREQIREAWLDGYVIFELPPQHSPWQPHVCLAYARDDLRAELTRRLGPLTFDRVRLAFGGEVHDVPLGQTATVAVTSGGEVVPWHVVESHGECTAGKPFAVVKDGTGEIEGCHATRDAANEQLAALYAAERGQNDAVNVDCVDCDDQTHFSGVAVELAWDGSASRFTDDEYRRSAAACDAGDAPPKTRCFLPHHDPGGALNRAGLGAAAARVNQVKHSAEAVGRARSHLRSHYRQLGEEVPDVLKASTDSVTLGDRRDDDGCGEGYHRMPDGSCMSDAEMAAASRWSGVLIVEGTPTGDGREFAVDALTWAEHALLRWQKEGSHGGDHDVTVSVGRIDEVWRDGNQVYGRGVLDLKNSDGFELWRRMGDGFAGGISVDADDITDADVELVWPEDAGDVDDDDPETVLRRMFGRPEKVIYHRGRVRAATVVDIPAFVEAYIALDGTDAVTTASVEPTSGAVPRHASATSDETWDRAAHTRRLPATVPLAVAASVAGWVSADAVRDGTAVRSGLAFLHHEVDDDGTPGAANLTACAAAIGALNAGRFASVPVTERRAVYEHLAAHLRDADREPPPATFDDLTVVAAGESESSWRPPRAWFADPKLSVPVGITVTDQGRVYGHAAQWGECHVGYADLCVTPPHEDAHPYFMTGELVCDDGSRVAVGQVTVGTGHAPLSYHASRAAEHYDNTGSVVADVAVGNDEHGIWVAGAVRATTPAARVHELRASGQVSGDWRRIGGQLRLVGLLAVNVPGFPVPRLRARVAGGAPIALVAAGQTSVGRVPPRDEAELDRIALKRVMTLLRERVRPTATEVNDGV